jgi:hypothetical protein
MLHRLGFFLSSLYSMHGLKTGGQQQKNPVRDLPSYGYHSSRERKHKIHKAEHPHEERELKEPGDKTDQKRDSHPEK